MIHIPEISILTAFLPILGAVDGKSAPRALQVAAGQETGNLTEGGTR